MALPPMFLCQLRIAKHGAKAQVLLVGLFRMTLEKPHREEYDVHGDDTMPRQHHYANKKLDNAAREIVFHSRGTEHENEDNKDHHLVFEDELVGSHRN